MVGRSGVGQKEIACRIISHTHFPTLSEKVTYRGGESEGKEKKMFVVYRVNLDGTKVKSYDRMAEFTTLDEAAEYMEQQKITDEASYTIVMES